MMPQSAVRRARLPVDTIGAGLDLHQPLAIEESPDADQGGDRLDGVENLAVRASDVAPATWDGREDARPRHVIEAGANGSERLTDHAQALARLLVHIALPHR